MNAHEKSQQTNRSRVMQTGLSLALITIAIALLIYMVTVEGELGALPLLLLVSGITWFAVARLRGRPRHG